MKCLIITDLNNSVPINLSYFEVFVQHLIVYRDQLCQMGFKPKYGCGLSFPLTCTILILYSCATAIYILVSWDSNSAKGKCTVFWTNLWLKKAVSNIQYELWVWFEKQGSWCFASLL